MQIVSTVKESEGGEAKVKKSVPLEVVDTLSNFAIAHQYKKQTQSKLHTVHVPVSESRKSNQRSQLGSNNSTVLGNDSIYSCTGKSINFSALLLK